MYCEKYACQQMKEILDIFVDCHPAQIEPLKGRASLLLRAITVCETVLSISARIDSAAEAFQALSRALKEREEQINETGN